MPPDYQNFLRLCYCVGCKIPNDSMCHFVTGINRDRVLQWAREVRLACATSEFCDSQSFSFEEGILEFDTASCGVRRNPTSREVNLGFAPPVLSFFFRSSHSHILWFPNNVNDVFDMKLFSSMLLPACSGKRLRNKERMLSLRQPKSWLFVVGPC